MGLSANPKSKQTTKDNTTFYSLKNSLPGITFAETEN